MYNIVILKFRNQIVFFLNVYSNWREYCSLLSKKRKLFDVSDRIMQKRTGNSFGYLDITNQEWYLAYSELILGPIEYSHEYSL